MKNCTVLFQAKETPMEIINKIANASGVQHYNPKDSLKTFFWIGNSSQLSAGVGENGDIILMKSEKSYYKLREHKDGSIIIFVGPLWDFWRHPCLPELTCIENSFGAAILPRDENYIPIGEFCQKWSKKIAEANIPQNKRSRQANKKLNNAIPFYPSN